VSDKCCTVQKKHNSLCTRPNNQPTTPRSISAQPSLQQQKQHRYDDRDPNIYFRYKLPNPSPTPSRIIIILQHKQHINTNKPRKHSNKHDTKHLSFRNGQAKTNNATTYRKASETFCVNHGLVGKDIGAPIVGGDEAESLFHIEPLDRAGKGSPARRKWPQGPGRERDEDLVHGGQHDFVCLDLEQNRP
jgi:hypothetical protein